MLLEDFNFTLPAFLIAQRPLAKRNGSRLLVLNKKTGTIAHRIFSDLPGLLNPNDLIVFNDTKVMPARLHLHRRTGGKIEIIVERILNEQTILAQAKKYKKLIIGEQLALADGNYFEVIALEEGLAELRLNDDISVMNALRRFGQVPLPPYIKRAAEVDDRDSYQTIYAKKLGAIAAPTAGLHFDQELLDRLRERGMNTAFITLHVGLGTFKPMRTHNIVEHKMHAEYVEVSAEVCAAVDNARKLGGRVVVVGTTTLRALESASLNGQLQPYRGETSIFIHGNYNFLSSDVLITNFHLPKTTLLILVCSFGGYGNVMRAYGEAIQSGYRFYSYGDAMMLG